MAAIKFGDLDIVEHLHHVFELAGRLVDGWHGTLEQISKGEVSEAIVRGRIDERNAAYRETIGFLMEYYGKELDDALRQYESALSSEGGISNG